MKKITVGTLRIALPTALAVLLLLAIVASSVFAASYYYGTDSLEYYPRRSTLQVYQNFFIPELGIGILPKSSVPIATTTPDSNAARQYAYWFLCNDAIGYSGAKQAEKFSSTYSSYASSLAGDTLFVDIENNYNDANCNWTTNTTHNSTVLNDFLHRLHALRPTKKIGLYASPGTFPGLMGTNYTFPTDIGTVVVWMAKTIGDKNCTWNGKTYNPETWTGTVADFKAGVQQYAEQNGIFTGSYKIGGKIPRVWQYCGDQGDIANASPLGGW